MWKFTTLFSLVFLLLIGAGCSSPSDNQESEKDTPAETSVGPENNEPEKEEESKEEQAENKEGTVTAYEMNSGYTIISSLEEVPEFFPDIPIPEGAVMEEILESEVGGSITVIVMYKLDGTVISGLGEEYKNFLEGSGFSSITYDDYEHTIKLTGFDDDLNMFHLQLYVEEGVISANISFKKKLEE